MDTRLLADYPHRAAANPTDLVKGSCPPALSPPFTPLHFSVVRMQAHYPAGSPYKNMRHAFASIWREGASGTGTAAGGVRALYRGVYPTTTRGIVLSVSQICSYDQAKQVLKRRGLMQEGVGLHFAASMFAG